MENENNTQLATEVTHNEVNVGTQPTTTQVENKKEEKTYSKEDLDKNAADTRRATERETKKKLLAQLGLSLDDEDKLNAYKEAYQNSLSDEEKRQTELTNLQTEKTKLIQDLEEKDYIIKALVALSGKNESDVEKIVKMAKGLKTEDNTIEDAIQDVMSMIKPVQPNTVITNNVDMPKGQEIQQPSEKVMVNTQDNPFKMGSINLTKQSELIRNNPELAKKLALEAGVNLRF